LIFIWNYNYVKMEIKNFEDYLIYDDGLVFSERRNIFLKTGKDRKGYEYVNLCKNCKYKTIKIHRLVAEHYIPNPENKSQVDHIDGNKLNNDISNLRWTTNIENNNNYKKIPTTNQSGFKNIHKIKYGFRFKKTIYGKLYTKYFKTLTYALCYKYIFNLKRKAGLI